MEKIHTRTENSEAFINDDKNNHKSSISTEEDREYKLL